MTQQLVEPLAWDTEFFGFPIGRVDLDGATEEALRAIETEARALGIVCLYGSLDPARGETAYHAQRYGYRLVEVGLKFGRPALPFTPKPNKSTVRRGHVDDLPQLEAAIDTLASWSRFSTDPRFGPPAARRMHAAWVERAAKDGEEYMLLVAEDTDGINGISTHVRTPIPRCDLMGVTRQGSGASWALMAAFLAWADGGPVEAGPCAARNIAPLRFVEHCGFDVRETRYHFHRWLDEDTGIRT